MRTSRRHDVRLPLGLATELESFAQKHGFSLGSAIRLLAVRGLEAATSRAAGDPDPNPDRPAALAALVASELTVLMVASILPEGQQRMHSLEERACQAAEERLAMFAEQRTAPQP
jgi:hypothetical protein